MRLHDSRHVGVAVCLAIVVSYPALSQGAPTLSITSPMNGTVVQPGQSVRVTVAATDSSLLTSEAIVGSIQLGGLSVIQPAGPQLTFSVTIPDGIVAGQYYITARGILGTGGGVSSTPVSLSVPITGSISTIRANVKTLVLAAPGTQGDLDIVATTTQGSVALDPETLSFVSSDPSVVTVNTSGQATAQGIGNAVITITYGSGSNSVSTTVSVLVQGGARGDLNGDGQIDIDDVNVLDMALNTPANGPNDARDLNHDGKIDALDARILTTLCTYPRCATHP